MIQGLEFRHGDELRPTLQIDHLQLKRGRSYAFVGESGSGKSTLLGLLRGLHQANPRVTCDGLTLEHGMIHLNHTATLIPQDPEIFSETILFNVTLGVEAPLERVMQAMRTARFERVMERLPHGLDTNIAEKGVSLSGGERQRLALARGIFFEGEIQSGLVLLDEPTSSVDSVNERHIYRAMLDEYSDRCLISAIHKFHLLEMFDEVVVFADGRIVQQGSLAELRRQGGELARLMGDLEALVG